MRLAFLLLVLVPRAAVSVDSQGLDACDGLQSILTAYYGQFTNTSAGALGPKCEGLDTPESNTVSGGFCLAELVAAGWYRASAVNIIASLILELDEFVGKVPVSTTSNSGGTMFTTRYMALRSARVDAKFSFPCYLLSMEFSKVCFAHGYFGELTSICESETFSVSAGAAYTVFGPLLGMYGGPFGVASTYIGVYWPFLADLPIPAAEFNYISFWTAHSAFNTVMGKESTWVIAATIVDPGNGYVYGWESYNSRGLPALTVDGAPNTGAWFANQTVYQVAAYSANSVSGISMIPVMLTKPWNGLISPMSIMLKLVSLALSLVSVNSMMAKQVIVVGSACGNARQCPIMDGGYTDNGPVTPAVSFASMLPAVMRPTQVAIAGPSSTFAVIKYTFGIGPLGLWSFSGINVCPFTQVSICTLIGKVKDIYVSTLEADAMSEYYSLASVYEFWKPEAQVFVPYCGDPLIYDNFHGECMTEGMCHTFATIVPGSVTLISWTTEVYIVTLTFVLESPTPLSARLVDKYIPVEMLRLDYYHSMSDWFPDYALTAPQKGGAGFTKYAGHSLLDFFTFLVQRLADKYVLARLEASNLYYGSKPGCGYKVYKKVEEFTIEGIGFS